MSEALRLNILPLNIEVVAGPLQGKIFSFKDKELIRVGRDVDNDIVLENDVKVSRHHVEIKFSDGHYYVYNKNNKNFILINNIKDDEGRIDNGSVIKLGDTELKIRLSAIISPVLRAVNSQTEIQKPNAFVQPANMNLRTNSVNENLVINSKLNPYINSNVNPKTNSNLNSQNNKNKKSTPNSIFLIGAIGVLALVYFFTKSDEIEEKTPKKNIVVPILEEEKRLSESTEALNAAKEKLKNMDSRKLLARQFLVSGMREFNNGQYQNAIDFLASAFQSDPSLEDAAKYYQKAKLNLDKLIDRRFSDGKRYRENNNYRLCKSSFQTVLFLIRNNIKHSRYIEAKQYYDECNSLDEVGRL